MSSRVIEEARMNSRTEKQELSPLGLLIKRTMDSRGWSFREAEEHMGVSSATLNRFYTGKLHRPTLEVALALAAFFDMGLEDVVRLGGIDVPHNRSVDETAAKAADLMGRDPYVRKILLLLLESDPERTARILPAIIALLEAAGESPER